MASLYQKNSTYYLSVSLDGKRKTQSLKTKDIKVAKKLKQLVEFELLKDLHGLNDKKKNISFKDLSILFLDADHDWSEKTREHYHYVLISWLNNQFLPINKGSADTFKRRLNAAINWGLRNGYTCCDLQKFKLSTPPARLRVFSIEEIKIIINEFEPTDFRRFCKLAYYTGARSGEIHCLSRVNIKNDHIVVNGKTGPRMVKLNEQAKKLIKEQKSLWNYSKNFVSHRFKKECRKLGIRDARFHDLRRTFG